MSFQDQNHYIPSPHKLIFGKGLSTDCQLAKSGSELTVNGEKAVMHVLVSRPVVASSVDEFVFIADRAYQVVSIKEVHAVASTSGTVAVRKVLVDSALPGVAAGAGTAVEFLTGAISLSGTANTLVTGTLSATVADLQIAANDRIALDFSGTMTSLVGGCLTIELKAI